MKVDICSACSLPKLETLDAGFGIDAMTLEVREAGAAISRQYGFMEEGNDKSLSELNDRVMNRQERAITALEAVASHIPERSERPQILVGLEGAAVQPATTVRPLMIFTAPEPARVIASVPDGPPMSLTWRRVTRRIVKAEGPERIAPEWWQMAEASSGPATTMPSKTIEGRRYWIFREGLYGEESGPPPKWFVHGLSA